MSGYQWQSEDKGSRIVTVDILAYVDSDYFDCKEFCVEFTTLADASDFLQILDASNFHFLQTSHAGKKVYLKPKCCHSCRKTIACLQGYDFLPKAMDDAYIALHLNPGTHWFNSNNFPITRPF